MTLAARAREPSAFLERRRQVRRGELEDRQQAEEQPGNERDAEREEQHQRVDADLGGPRQSIRRIGDENAQAGVGQDEANDAARQREREALREELPRDSAPAGAERGMNREFLLPRFGPHEEQVRDVRAGDEQHEADGPEEHPKDAPDVADHVNRQRANIGTNLHVVEHLARETARHREPLRHDRDEARDVGVRLLDRHSRLQSSDALIAEVSDVELGAIEAEGKDKLRILIEEAESVGEDADDFARAAVDCHRFSDDRWIAPELSLPVGVGQQHTFWALRRVVVRAERASEDRVDV